MAAHLFRINWRYIYSPPIDRRNALLYAKSIYKACYVGDNRVMYHRAHPEGQSENDVDIDERSTTNIGVDGKRENIKEPNYVPREVEKVRKQMQNLHNLPDVTPHTLPHRVTSNNDSENDEQEMTEDETQTNPIDLKVLKSKFSFLENHETGDDMERVIETSFGFVRFDTNPSQEIHAKPTENTQDYVDDQYFALNLTNVDSSEDYNKDDMNLSNTSTLNYSASDKSNRKPAVSVIEENYEKKINPQVTNFESQKFHEESLKTNKQNQRLHCQRLTNIEQDNDNLFDEQYFGNQISNEQRDPEKMLHDEEVINSKLPLDHLPEITLKDRKEIKETRNKDNANFFDEQFFPNKFTGEKVESDRSVNSYKKADFVHHDMDSSEENETTKGEDIFVQTRTEQEVRVENRQRPNFDTPKTPYDMAMKIRQEIKKKTNEAHPTKQERTPDQNVGKTQVTNPKLAKWGGKVDSKGYRILTGQVLNLNDLPRDVVVKILHDSILYEDDGLLAIYKPYGLPSHGGPGVHHSVGRLLDPLAHLINPKLEKLYLVHRLDKETTGVMLLAKNQQSEHLLHNMFVKQQIIKKYWLLTSGIPEPPEGVIDIPMAEGTVGEKSRMTLRPQHKLLHRSSQGQGGIFSAVTNYKVLDSNHHAALVQCQPESGVKHQIRCHMAFALNTPILGDHKYSHYSKLAPQRLHPETLLRLGIRQAKVRHLAVHLHAKQIILPEYKDGRNLFISANLPKHFVQNMKWLQLQSP